MADLFCSHDGSDVIMLPADLRHRSSRRARERGVSFGELVRESLSDRAVYKGRAPSNLAAEHDAHLYGDQE
jgi:hypothetical protein